MKEQKFSIGKKDNSECTRLPMTPPKLYSGACSHGEGASFLKEPFSSSSGPLLASLSAFWLRLSEKASSLVVNRTHNAQPASSERLQPEAFVAALLTGLGRRCTDEGSGRPRRCGVPPTSPRTHGDTGVERLPS